MGKFKAILLYLICLMGIIIPAADTIITSNSVAQAQSIEAQQVTIEAGEKASNIKLSTSIDEWSDVVKEQGVRNASFVVLVLLLMTVMLWILRSFPEQIREERKLYREELKAERDFDQKERQKDRDSFEERQKSLVEFFETKLERFTTDIVDHLESCPLKPKR